MVLEVLDDLDSHCGAGNSACAGDSTRARRREETVKPWTLLDHGTCMQSEWAAAQSYLWRPGSNPSHWSTAAANCVVAEGLA